MDVVIWLILNGSQLFNYQLIKSLKRWLFHVCGGYIKNAKRSYINLSFKDERGLLLSEKGVSFIGCANGNIGHPYGILGTMIIYPPV